MGDGAGGSGSAGACLDTDFDRLRPDCAGCGAGVCAGGGASVFGEVRPDSVNGGGLEIDPLFPLLRHNRLMLFTLIIVDDVFCTLWLASSEVTESIENLLEGVWESGRSCWDETDSEEPRSGKLTSGCGTSSKKTCDCRWSSKYSASD